MKKPSLKEVDNHGCTALEQIHDWQPHIVALVCRWCTYAGADLAGTSRLTYPANVRLLRFPCTGRIDPLYILKSFEHGADGVLVSGCHPGDCHYLQGNLVARRRFTLLRSVLHFFGLDPRRLHFSWVSAAEGVKWVRVVEEVTEAVQTAGPFNWKQVLPVLEPITLSKPDTYPGKESRKTPTQESYQAATQELRDLVNKLFLEQQISLCIGYGRGTLAQQIVPLFIRDAEQAKQLVWTPSCAPNLSVYLSRLKKESGKVGILVKRCDLKSVVGLLNQGQVEREKICLIGLTCQGLFSDDGLAQKCSTCDGQVPQLCDFVVGENISTSQPVLQVAKQNLVDEQIIFLDSLSPEARWTYWQSEFARCIRCYACRGICPFCFCESCITEKHRPQWISPSISCSDNMVWNVVRALHQAGRCTQCAECSRVCPANIRLDLINRKIALEIEKLFGYKAGFELGSTLPLVEFYKTDPDEFIL